MVGRTVSCGNPIIISYLVSPSSGILPVVPPKNSTSSVVAAF